MSAPGKIVLHRMGFYNDQSGILRRYTAEASAWEPHLNACKNIILKALSDTGARCIVVLGAGFLIDLPLRELASGNRTVTLVDIVPPLPAVRDAANFKGVSFLEDDVSGGLIERVYRFTPRNFLKSKINIASLLDFKPWAPPKGTEMIISLNILTQLGALPVDYLRRKTNITSEEEMVVRRTVQERHLEMLQKHNSVLITDFSEVATAGETLEAPVPLLEIDLPAGIINEQWDWHFDSHNSYNAGKKTTFRVAGIVFRR